MKYKHIPQVCRLYYITCHNHRASDNFTYIKYLDRSISQEISIYPLYNWRLKVPYDSSRRMVPLSIPRLPVFIFWFDIVVLYPSIRTTLFALNIYLILSPTHTHTRVYNAYILALALVHMSGP